jgi:DNA repair exonuclease SbcCD ATPase subunit
MGQGRNVHYPSLPPKEQKAVLEQILPMEEVDRWADYADKQVKNLKGKATESERDLTIATTRTKTLQVQLGKSKVDGVTFEEQRDREIQQAEVELGQVRVFYAPEYEALAKLQEQLNQTNTEDIQAKIDAVDEQMQSYMARLNEESRKAGEANNVNARWVDRLRFLRGDLKGMDKDTSCPVCLRDYDSTTVEAVAERITKQEALIEEAKINYDQSETAQLYYSEQARQAQEQVHILRLKRDRLEKDLVRQSDHDRDKKVIDSKAAAAIEIAKSRLAYAKEKINPYAETYQRLESEIMEAKKEQTAAFQTDFALRAELEHLLHWRDVYGKELKLRLFEDACPFLDSRTEYHLGRLSNSQIHCEFTTVKRLANGTAKEEFNVNVWSETGGRGFDSLSGGEQQMVSFAVGLALSDLSSSQAGATSGFLILDEPFTELDARNGEAVVEYLTTEVEGGRDTILLISNDEALKGLIPNRIHVVKERGVTEVVEA